MFKVFNPIYFNVMGGMDWVDMDGWWRGYCSQEGTAVVQTREMIIKIKLLAVPWREVDGLERVGRLGSQDWMKLGEKGGIKGDA